MIDLFRTRRSIRKYQDRKIEPEKMEILKEVLLRSPSSRDNTPWEFIFVQNKDTLNKLSECKKNGAGFLKDASLGIIICGDETQSDVWVENCSIASIMVQLAAHSIGLGSCWIQIRNRYRDRNVMAEQYIQEMLSIPDFLRVESIISIGYPAEKKPVIPVENLDFTKIRLEKY